MDEYIIIGSSEAELAVLSNTDSIYSGVESITLQDFDLAQNGFVGFGAAAIGVFISIAIAGLIRFFYSM